MHRAFRIIIDNNTTTKNKNESTNDNTENEKVRKFPSNHQPTKNASTIQQIPRVIVQTNEHSVVPYKMYEAMNSIIEMNPEYRHEFFDEERRRKYIRDNFPERVIEAYLKLIPGAYRSDLFRFCYIFKTGGVYIDSSMLGIRPLSELITAYDIFVVPEDNERDRLCTGFIASAPRSVIFATLIDEIVQHVEMRYYGDNPLDVTGPRLFGAVFSNFYKKIIRANRTYTAGVRTIAFINRSELIFKIGYEPRKGTGQISDKEKIVMIVKYDGYQDDMLWYTDTEHYSKLWEEKEIYTE